MELVFDRGDRGSPKGHALLYFRSPDDPEAVWVTYIVILPITVDVSKYVPPFLMNQVNELGPTDLSAFAFPPAPERLGSYSEMEAIAAQRDDDVLFAGATDATDVSARDKQSCVEHRGQIWNVVGMPCHSHLWHLCAPKSSGERCSAFRGHAGLAVSVAPADVAGLELSLRLPLISVRP